MLSPDRLRFTVGQALPEGKTAIIFQVYRCPEGEPQILPALVETLKARWQISDLSKKYPHDRDTLFLAALILDVGEIINLEELKVEFESEFGWKVTVLLN